MISLKGEYLMDSRELLRKEIETMPDALVKEVLRFVKALKEGTLPALSRELLNASESSLARDWLRGDLFPVAASHMISMCKAISLHQTR